MKVAQACLTLCNTMDCSLPVSSAHGILQAGVLEWVAIPFSRGSFQARNQTEVSWMAGRLPAELSGKKIYDKIDSARKLRYRRGLTVLRQYEIILWTHCVLDPVLHMYQRKREVWGKTHNMLPKDSLWYGASPNGMNTTWEKEENILRQQPK